jgi:hypothetical protein
MTELVAGPPVSTETTRRFNVGDSLILLAAICLGIAGIRDRILTFVPRVHRWNQDLDRYLDDRASAPPVDPEELDFSLRSLVIEASDEGQAWLLSVLVGLTPAQILLRLRRPRPGWRDLVHQPGFIACLAAVAGYLIDRGWDDSIGLRFAAFPFWTSMAVLAAWALLLILKRCRAERRWIDRLGRVLGTAWIVAGFWPQLEHYYFW